MSLISSVPSTIFSSVPSEVPSNNPSTSNNLSIPSARPLVLPEDTTTNIPSTSRETLVPSDVRPVVLGSTQNPSLETSGVRHYFGSTLFGFAGAINLLYMFRTVVLCR
jgi:hypothetical protein